MLDLVLDADIGFSIYSDLEKLDFHESINEMELLGFHHDSSILYSLEIIFEFS